MMIKRCLKRRYPNSTQDIKDESVSQNNCVASYIDKVIDGECHILFLRKKDNPSQSLITIEIRNGSNDRRCRKYKRRKEQIERWRRKNGSFRGIGNNVYCSENTWVNTVVMVMGT